MRTYSATAALGVLDAVGADAGRRAGLTDAGGVELLGRAVLPFIDRAEP